LIVAKISEIPENGSIIVMVEERKVALFKVDGKVYAMDNTCPHAGGSLGEGHLDGSYVTCPWHAWQFNVTTGDCVTVPQDRIRSYPVEIQGEDIVLNSL